MGEFLFCLLNSWVMLSLLIHRSSPECVCHQMLLALHPVQPQWPACQLNEQRLQCRGEAVQAFVRPCLHYGLAVQEEVDDLLPSSEVLELVQSGDGPQKFNYHSSFVAPTLFCSDGAELQALHFVPSFSPQWSSEPCGFCLLLVSVILKTVEA